VSPGSHFFNDLGRTVRKQKAREANSRAKSPAANHILPQRDDEKHLLIRPFFSCICAESSRRVFSPCHLRRSQSCGPM